ncbi:MAG: hypothetical protein SNH27_10975 [Rikenellaceae bacterium]
MKTIFKTITAERESKALADSKKNGFPVAFGDKELFQTLRIEIVRESGTRIFEITKEHLPNNKTNTTRFYLKEGGEIKWCSKVAENMHEVK